MENSLIRKYHEKIKHSHIYHTMSQICHINFLAMEVKIMRAI